MSERSVWSRSLCAAAIVLALWPAATPVAQTTPSELPSPGAATPEKGGAEGIGPETKLPLPRYASLRSDEINVRRGPGLSYKKDWVFRRARLPVRIIGEYRDWRQIVDSDNAGGWVYHALLSGRRTVLVTAEMVELRDEAAPEAPVVAEAERGVVADLVACTIEWCEIEADRLEGWVPKHAIWGVDRGEIWPK